VLLNRYLADLARIEIEERNRRLVNRNEVEAAMLMIARRTAHVLALESDPANIEAILANQIRAALRVVTVAQ
jgi:membrane protein YqaA with SNARE-associated domain